ncbi:MAG TPA: hypothetical protein GXZ90_08770 [Clostridiales bacterium]|nr:hypothetical protein [Clostridiales bacterium]
MKDEKFLIFKIDDKDIALDLSEVNIIEHYIKPVIVESESKTLIGYIKARGNTLPLFSLRKKFDLDESEANEETKLLTIQYEEFTVAFKVDSVDEIIDARLYEVYDAPSVLINEENRYLKGIIHKEGRILLLFHHDMLLTDKEKEEGIKVLKKLQEEEKKEQIKDQQKDQQKEKVIQQKKEQKKGTKKENKTKGKK